MRNSLVIFLILTCLVISEEVQAQSPCALEAEQAIELYNQGRYDSLITFARSKLNNSDCPRQQREVLQKYIASAYYAIDNLEEGNLYVDSILQKNPYFEINLSQDPQAFTENFRMFVVSPGLSVGLKIGSNLSTMFITREYTVMNPGESYYINGLSTGAGYQFGMLVRSYFSMHISSSIELDYYSQSYERKITGFRNSTVTFNERFNNYRIPLLLNYSFRPNKRLVPEVYAGLYFSGMTGSHANIKSSSSQFIGDTAGTGNIDEYGLAAFTDDIEMTDQRRLRNYGVLGGGRLIYQINGLRIFAELRFLNDLKNFVNPEKRYDNALLIYDYYYIDSDALIFTNEISMGVSLVLFHNIKQRFR